MLVWEKNAVRDVLDLFGGKIKSIVSKGGAVYGRAESVDEDRGNNNEGTTETIQSNTP